MKSFHKKHKNKVIISTLLLVFILFLAIKPMSTAQEEVPQVSDETGFKEINGNIYYYNEEGNLEKGWIEYEGSWYYLNPENNQLAIDKWLWTPINVNGNESYVWKYFDKEGKSVDQFYKSDDKTWLSQAGPNKGYIKGWWQNESGMTYYFRENSGTRVHGWQWIDGGWRFFRNSGTMMINTWGWAPVDLDNNGTADTHNWKFFNDGGINITKYYYNNDSTWLSQKGPNNQYYRGWYKDSDGSTYYFRESSGTKVKGWQCIDGSWRYFGDEGSQVFGWKKINNNLYYFNEKDGIRNTKDLIIDDVVYIFNNSGVVIEKRANTKYPMEAGSTSVYSIGDFEWMGIVNWGGKKFSYYSERVLPGYGLRIPGRYTEDGFVRDGDGYIVLASDYYAKGTIISTPFGADGKVYDRFGTGQPASRFDVYTR
mgnify:CR=1 FL=1